MEGRVIVVGAGPVGLMLAGELRLGGVEVVVLEQLAAPTTESRASTLHARSMELLDQRGLLDELGTVPRESTGHFGGIPLDLGAVDSPYAGQWKVAQAQLEKLLASWASGLGADIRRRHTVRALVQASDHVEVEADGPDGPVRLRASYVVGCDGESSTVRQLAGFELAGVEATRELLRADIVGLDIRPRRFERTGAGLAVAGRLPGGVTRVMVHEFGRPATHRTREPEFAEIAAAWQRVTGEDISGGRPVWCNAFSDARLQVTTYRKGRVLLAGDAAHVQLPVGGQALNVGLQDAVNLGWKLAAQVRGWAPEGLLDTYHEERHAAAARVQASIAQQTLILLGGPEIEAPREVLGELLRFDTVREHLAKAASGVDVRYDVPGEHPLLGTRLPHVPLQVGPERVDTADLLRPAWGVLLCLDPGAARRIVPAAKAWGDRVRVVTAEAPAAGPLAGVRAVLVRPDGHIAWVDDGAGDPRAALRRWFGRPTPSDRRMSTTSNEERNVMGNLVGKTALVTGASRGIGRAIAERLGREGALVAVHYATNREAAEDTVASVIAGGGRAFAVQAPFGVPGDVDTLFHHLEQGLKEHTGRTDLDILVNNAGILGDVSPEETTPELFDRIMAVNARAPFFIVQRALSIMPDGGRIVNISSGLTRRANPQEIAYAMSKSAVEMIALHFARHVAPRGITVNTVAPGVTDNGGEIFRNPQAVAAMAQFSAFNRVGDPADVASVVAFLVSDEARWVTGAFIDATGGSLLG